MKIGIAEFETENGLIALKVRTNNFDDASKGIDAFGSTGVYGDGDVSGVHGYSYENIGVYGESGTGPQGTLVTYGVHGKSTDNYNGVGVYGLGKRIGVQGESSTVSGVGVYGASEYGNGIAPKSFCKTSLITLLA